MCAVLSARNVAKTEVYDDTKVQAILNEIAGKDHAGTKAVGVPKIFGMNFQAISVAQKLVGGGYVDAAGTPSAGLSHALDHTDLSLGKMLESLKANGLLNSTLVI